MKEGQLNIQKKSIAVSAEEYISAFVDERRLDNSLLDKLLTNSNLQESWQRYHLIRTIMRKEMPNSFDFKLTERISQKINLEPVQVSKKTHFMLLKKLWQTHAVGTISQWGQHAIAALSVIVVIVSVQYYNSLVKANTAPISVLNTFPIGGAINPVALAAPDSSLNNIKLPVTINKQSLDDKSTHLTKQQLKLQNKRISAFLQDHRLRSQAIEKQ